MYDKHLYVFDGNTPREAVIRNYTTDDFADLIRVQQESLEDEESLNHAVLMEWRNPFKQKQGQIDRNEKKESPASAAN
ncbi:hypothetical protein ABEO92_09900 [Geobacillus stearothermophilus]|uniref:hypothetical protein n=1 Tax=Geobacillus stearothermophilus TaxID=1422 RepID=UPI003D24598D